MSTGVGSRSDAPGAGVRKKRSISRRASKGRATGGNGDDLAADGNGQHPAGNGNGQHNRDDGREVPAGLEGTGAEELALVNASIDGSLKAFEELYTRYLPKVRAFCYRKTGSNELAQDIAQEAFTRAFERMEGFGGPKRFGSWVGTIAANLVTDHYRRKSTTDVSLEQVGEAERLPSEHNDPLANIERETARRVLRPALQKLQPRQREALLLREVEGMSCAAVGEKLGISEVAVGSLLARGRRRLRREILTKAAPEELFGAGVIAPLAPVFRAWRRFREGVVRKAHWVQSTAARTLDGLGAGVMPAEQAAKALVVVLGTALALDAAAALLPKDTAASAPKPAVVVERAGAGNPTAKDGSPGGERLLTPIGGREDLQLDPESQRARGSVQGSVDPAGETTGHTGVNYSFHVEGDTERGSARGRVFVNDGDGNTVADTDEQSVDWSTRP